MQFFKKKNIENSSVSGVKGKTLRIFDVTDIHGSTLCFRKLIAALDYYKVDVLLLGGDMTGKMVVPIVREARNYVTQFSGTELILSSDDEMRSFALRMEEMGFYPTVLEKDEFDALRDDKLGQERVFHDLIAKRLREWIEYGEERLRGREIQLYCAPGNDDELFVDDILAESTAFVNVEGRKVMLKDGREMVSSGWSNPTPWNTEREATEEELMLRLRPLIEQVEEFSTAIFNMHAPPYNTKIDECPALDKDLKAVSDLGHPVFRPVGSLSVRQLIEQYQPLLAIHGHIHEGRGTAKLGRTTCVNPGSEYSEGVLQGVILSVEGDRIRDIQFTSG